VTYSLGLDDADPQRLDVVTFTATFPQDAFRQARNRQFSQNPYLNLLCTHDDQRVLAMATSFNRDSKNRDGSVNATSYPVTLWSNGGNGVSWPEGYDAEFTASSGYWTYSKAEGAVHHPVGWLQFHVGPGTP